MGWRDWLTAGPPLFRASAPPREVRLNFIYGYEAAFLPPTNMLVHGPGATDALMAPNAQGDGNSAVFACLAALAAAYIEAPLRVYQTAPGAARQQVQSGAPLALQRLLDSPNPAMTGQEVWHWVQWAKHVDGNAYLRKVRAGDGTRGNVVELWPLSPTRVELRSAPGQFLSAYRWHYGPGAWEDLPPANVLHFRLGLDDQDHRRGLAPLKRLVRALTTDAAAEQWAAALLSNGAVPGLVVQTPGQLTQDQADLLKAKLRALYGGDRRGDVGVLDAGATLQQLGWNPEQMAFAALSRQPETRIAGVLRVPAIVAGLGVGLDQATYCLPAEARVWTLAGPQPIQGIRPGHVVWAYADGQLRPRRVTRAGCTGHKALYELRTKNRTLRATGNHPVLVRAGGRQFVWRSVAQLQVGDQVVQPKCLPDQNGETLPDGRMATAAFVQFCGAIVGDGTVTAGHDVRMAIPASDRCGVFYRDLARECLVQYAGGGERPWKRAQDGKTALIVAGRDAGASWHALGREVGLAPASVRDRYQHAIAPLPVQTRLVHICEQPRSFACVSAISSRYLAALGLDGRAHTKRVPGWVWGLRASLRLAFLAGLVDTDGAIDKRGALSFTFCNRALAHDVRDLLVSVGIQACNVRYFTQAASKLPQPGTRALYEAWSFTASNTTQVARIPFADPLYRARVEANAKRGNADGGTARRTGLDGALGAYRLLSIRPLPAEAVFDLTVEGGHSFVADGIVVHNSNARTLTEFFTERTMIPLWTMDAAKLQQQLVPDFTADPRVTVAFDLTDVRALQEDEDAKYTRLDKAVAGGWFTVNEARQESGADPLPGGDVRRVPITVVEVPVGQPAPIPQSVLPVTPPSAQPAPPADVEPPPPPGSTVSRRGALEHGALDLSGGTVTAADLAAWRARARALGAAAPLLPGLLAATPPTNGHGHG